MSGGTFDYLQYRLEEAVDRIQEEIDNNNIKPEWYNAYNVQYWNGYRWTDDTIAEFKKGIELIQKAKIYMQRIDWLLAEDDGEETFHKRLKEDLEKQGLCIKEN